VQFRIAEKFRSSGNSLAAKRFRVQPEFGSTPVDAALVIEQSRSPFALDASSSGVSCVRFESTLSVESRS
jgi:hypothetical protein